MSVCEDSSCTILGRNAVQHLVSGVAWNHGRASCDTSREVVAAGEGNCIVNFICDS